MLSRRRFDSTHAVYLTDGDRELVGMVTLEDLFASDPDAVVSDLMQPNLPFVRDDIDREDAASLAIKESLAEVPVVDRDGKFVGVFSSRAIMAVLRDEHLEDLHHMAGIWHDTNEARQALQAPPLTRARYRLPWLVIGLAGSMLAMTLVARFEQVLEAQIAVAFFIPAIVYLADAVGTQSEAVAVRGLSLTNAGIGRLLAGEISAGALMGVTLAVLAGAFTHLWFGRMDLALVVGVSLAGACTIATGLGLALPWAFSKAGWDPALASGPVGTIVQDVLSLLVYFIAASTML
jgi:magnesium transporter